MRIGASPARAGKGERCVTRGAPPSGLATRDACVQLIWERNPERVLSSRSLQHACRWCGNPITAGLGPRHAGENVSHPRQPIPRHRSASRVNNFVSPKGIYNQILQMTLPGLSKWWLWPASTLKSKTAGYFTSKRS